MRNISKISKNTSKAIKSALNSRLLAFSCFTLLIFLSIRCASIQAPTGGPKDSIPPKVLAETPANLTKNFAAQKILIELDEFIKLNNQSKEISISPEMEKAPIFKVKKKNLEITLPDSLAANTTYTINFGKGLVDYNESNPLLNYSYVFATGNEIDSLSIAGNVKSARTQEVLKEVKVLLIPTSQDSIFGKKKANIFALTDTAGNFKISNLREDTYRVYALKESNNDRIYNGVDEEIGFLADSIHLDRDITGINLEIFKAIPPVFRTIDRKIEKNGRILFSFNRRVIDPSLQIIGTDIPNKRIQFSPGNDSAFVFVENLNFDSLKFQLNEGKQVLDTILLKRSGNEKYERFIEPITSIKNAKVDRVKHITFTSLIPIENVDKSKIKIMEDSVSRTNFQLQLDTNQANLYHIRYNWRDQKNYELIVEEGALQGYFKEINKEHKSKFTLDKTDNYGDIELTFDHTDSSMHYIVELIDERKEKVFSSQILPANHKITYSKYPGGKYTLRVIYDANKNGLWDTGDVYQKIQPEKIWYLNRVFTIRANWEQKETISLP